MKFPYKISVQNGGSVSLSKNDYLAAGGEGTILQKGGTAYKVYHDPAKMIPVSKIEELTRLKHLKNVLGPQSVIFNTGKPVGFSMRYVTDTEFMCRLFNRNYRKNNNITPTTIVELVKNLQKTLSDIHKENILVVDFNEMNFLVDKSGYTLPYFIDVDSYQTPKHKATALMESIRDRSLNQRDPFSELSDWFSFGVVAFQLYMGIHPYKGKHPSYAPKDWSKRMDANISVYDSAVTLPNSCQDWSVIPKPHNDWFKRVFQDGERSIPPLPDQFVPVAIIQPTLITGNNSFDVHKVFTAASPISKVYYFFEVERYILCKDQVYKGNQPVAKLTKQYKNPALCAVNTIHTMHPLPVLTSQGGNTVSFFDIQTEEKIAETKSSSYMERDGLIFTTNKGKLIQNTFHEFKRGKIILSSETIGDIFEPAHKFFDGLVVQDILGQCWVSIPHKLNNSVNIHIKELDKHRVLEAKCDENVAVILSELNGKYYRSTVLFSFATVDYSIRIENDVSYDSVSLAQLGNGINVSVAGDSLVEVFKDIKKIKQVPNPPITSDMELISDGTSIQFIMKNTLYSLKLK